MESLPRMSRSERIFWGEWFCSLGDCFTVEHKKKRTVNFPIMDIKIGLAESPRELVVSSKSEQDDVVGQITHAIESNQPTVTLEDSKGRKFVIRTDRISYVEVGQSASHTVGFAG